jgi:catechol 2,3-dioxygenase-like lactoylglutathione lyase family enzyme
MRTASGLFRRPAPRPESGSLPSSTSLSNGWSTSASWLTTSQPRLSSSSSSDSCCRVRGASKGRWVDRVVGLEDVRADLAMMQTPDGNGRLELTKFHSPSNQGDDRHAPANAPGIRHVAFAVEDIDAVVAGLRARGAELVGELERYKDSYRLCYVRGPEGIIIELAEQIG